MGKGVRERAARRARLAAGTLPRRTRSTVESPPVRQPSKLADRVNRDLSKFEHRYFEIRPTRPGRIRAVVRRLLLLALELLGLVGVPTEQLDELPQPTREQAGPARSAEEPPVRRAPAVPLDLAQSTLRSSLARAIAQTLVDGIDNTVQEERPLTLLQQTDLITMGVMAYASAVDDGEAGLATWSKLVGDYAADARRAARRRQP